MPYDLRKSPYRCLSCETRQQECRCCDVGNDYGFFDLTIAGCDGLAGRHTVTLRRYRDPETIATGVSYPASDPCGVFWGTITNGEGCSTGGTNWGGSIGFLNWCDGTDAAIPWHVEVFCYNADSSTWVSQGEATVTSFQCTCRGAMLEFTLPELDCCCEEEPGPCECDGVNYPDEALTLEIIALNCAAIDGTTVSLTMSGTAPDCTHSGTSQCGGQDNPNVFVLTCSGGQFRLRVDLDGVGGGMTYQYDEFATSSTESPFLLVFPAATLATSSIGICDGGCDGTAEFEFAIT